MDASLVMRDRETDSWWSIMTSNAIGGELDGTDLVELPRGEKSTWKSWRAKHPDTLVLSVEGEEHVDNNPYDNYFASEGTFRDLQIDDQRLEPKAPIYSFWLAGVPYAAPHQAFEGGNLFEVEDLPGRRIFLYRSPGSPIFEGSRAFLVDEEVAAAEPDPEWLLTLAGEGRNGIEPLPGFDTFWYTWVAVNKSTRLIE